METKADDMRVIIITGVSKGLGRAFFDILKDKDCYLVCISRSFVNYQIELAELNGNIELIKLDLGNTDDLILKLKNLSIALKGYDFDELIFINNAGTISPIEKVGDINDNDIKEAININFTSPALITNYLSALCSKNIKLKLLNITTGAATKLFEGWSIYCSTKAAAKMFFSVVEKEGAAIVKNIDPGALNTNMQSEIRNTSESSFPSVQKFRNLEKNNRLQNPSYVAFDILKSNNLI